MTKIHVHAAEDYLKWFALSLALVSLAIFFSYSIFPSQASILTISFLVIALTPPLYTAMATEEEVVACKGKECSFFRRYDGIIFMVIALSAGIFLSFSFWYGVLPSDAAYDGMHCSTKLPCKEAIFSLQADYAGEPRTIGSLFAIAFFCFALSLFLGAGAILIITWDLSTLVFVEQSHMGFLAYLPQSLAYFLIGLSGALLSFAVIRHEWRGHAFLIVVKDSLKLAGIGLLLLLLSYFLIPLP